MLTAEQIKALSRKTLVVPIQIGQSVLIEINGKNEIIGQIKNFDQDNVTVELNDEGYYAILPIEIISPVDSKAVNDIVGFLPSYDENGPEIKAIKDAGYETGSNLGENIDSEFKKDDVVTTPDGEGKILKFRKSIEHWIVQMDNGDENGYPAKDLKLVSKPIEKIKESLDENELYKIFKTCDSAQEFLDGIVTSMNADQEDTFEDLAELAWNANMNSELLINNPNYPKNPQSFFNKEYAIELYNKLKNIDKLSNNKIKLIIVGDNKDGLLGYINPRTPNNVSVLTARGQYLSDKNGGYDLKWLNHMYKEKGGVKLATKNDFDEFRTNFDRYDNGEYEYANSIEESHGFEEYYTLDELAKVLTKNNVDASVVDMFKIECKSEQDRDGGFSKDKSYDLLKMYGNKDIAEKWAANPINESIDSLSELELRHFKEFFILCPDKTLEDFVEKAEFSIKQIEYWTKDGDNVESNQLYIDAMENIIAKINDGTITESDTEPYKEIGRNNESKITETKVFRGINKSGNVNATYNGNDDGMGTFYTDNETMAKWFAGLEDYDVDKESYVPTGNTDGEVITDDINLKNPYIIDSEDEDNDSFQVYMDEIKESGGVEAYKEKLIAEGHDGIILQNCNTNYYNDGTYTIYIDFENDKTDESVEKEITKFTVKGHDYWAVKHDSTHCAVVNNEQAAKSNNQLGVGHIQQFSSEPYFDDLKAWLKGGEKLDGKIYESKAYRYEIHYSDGVRQMIGADSESDAIKKSKELVKNNKNIRELDIFRNASGFHSTTQFEYLVGWYSNGNSYWKNVAEKDDKVKQKELKLNESSDETIDLVIGYVDDKPKTILKSTDKIPSFVQSTKKIRIPKQDWEAEKINFTNMRWYVDTYGVSTFDEASGANNSVELPNSNLWLIGGGIDMNGNRVVKLSFPNSRSFSIQTGNGRLFETEKLLRGDVKPDLLTDENLETIEMEIIAYIQQFGSRFQKSELKVYKPKNESKKYEIGFTSESELEDKNVIDTISKLKSYIGHNVKINGLSITELTATSGSINYGGKILTYDEKRDNQSVLINKLETVKDWIDKQPDSAYVKEDKIKKYEIGFTSQDYNKLVADVTADYPFYGKKNAPYWDIYDEKTDEKVGAYNGQKNILKVLDDRLSEWLKTNSYENKLDEAVNNNQMKSFINDFNNNNIIDIKLQPCDPKELVPLNVSDSPKSYFPKGYFKVKKDFKITPGGGWQMSFKIGEIVFSDGKGTVESTNNKRMLNALNEFNPFIFKSRRPPIQGTNKLILTNYARNPEQRNMYNSFVENVESISGEQAYDIIMKFFNDYSPVKETAITETEIAISPIADLKSSVLYIPLKQSKDFDDFLSKLDNIDATVEDIREFCSVLGLNDASVGYYNTDKPNFDENKLEIAYNKGKKSLGNTQSGVQVPQGGLSRTVWTNPVITSYKGENGYLGSNQAQYRTDALDREIESYFRSLGMDDDMIACFLVGKEGRWLSTALKNGADWKSFIKNTAIGFIANFDPTNKMAYQEALIKENNGLIFEKSQNPLQLTTSNFSKYRELDSNQYIPNTTWSKFMDNFGLGIDDMDRICKYAGFSSFEKLVDSGITPKSIKTDIEKYRDLLDGLKIVSYAARNMTDDGLDMLVERFIVETDNEDTGSAKYINKVQQRYDSLVKQYNENPGDKKILIQLNDCETYLGLPLTKPTIVESAPDFIGQIAASLKELQKTDQSQVENLKLDIERWEQTKFDDDDAKQIALSEIIDYYKQPA